MMDWHIETADVMDWAARYDGPKFHALLCDPPYELGFMGKDWDRSGIAFKSETWAALAEHLLPGAFGMAFASARGWHRLAVAIEDAGYRIHPSIFGWCYGSGFPKATRIDTQVDKAAGAERPDKVPGGHKGMHSINDPASQRHRDLRDALGPQVGIGQLSAGTPQTELAQSWQGHRYGLQAMKPALEPIIVFQKPYAGKPVESITETGAGALWIDGSRIGMGGGGGKGLGSHYDRLGNTEPLVKHGKDRTNTQGRWPANFTLTHAPGCVRVGEKRVKPGPGAGSGKVGDTTNSPRTRAVYGDYAPIQQRGFSHAAPDGLETIAAWDCVPECPVRRLGEQSGESKSSGSPIRQNGSSWKCANQHGVYDRICDKGTAARFFHQSDWSYEIAERLAQADPVHYVAKASRKERDAGLEGIEPKIIGHNLSSNACAKCGKRVKANGSGDKCECGDKRVTIKLPTATRNPHPTVKPIALTRWLATLLLPPVEYAPRRLMVPFAGTGSEMAGGGLVGWERILGIEMDADTVDIANARLEHWLEQSKQLAFIEAVS